MVQALQQMRLLQHSKTCNMKIHSKQALGTILEIHIPEDAHQKDIDECFLSVETFENTYSRFIPDNFLYQLNHSGQSNCPKELKEMISYAQNVYQQTSGYFDITLLPFLENSGYGIAPEKIPEHTWMQHIEIQSDTITLHNNVCIDLWGIGKWYILDTVYNLLQDKYPHYILNFWGDIRTCGTTTVWLEDPLRPWKIIGELQLENRAFCASSGEKRKLGTEHHILNPKTQRSPTDKLAIYTTHLLGVYADMYATALFACPLDEALKILENTPELEALIITREGKMHCSQGFHKYLTLY